MGLKPTRANARSQRIMNRKKGEDTERKKERNKEGRKEGRKEEEQKDIKRERERNRGEQKKTSRSQGQEGQ